MKDKILKIITGIATITAAVFYVLFQKKKTEQLQEKLETEKAKVETAKKQTEQYVKGMKENEELKNKAHIGNNIDRDNAASIILQNAAKKGRQRNS